MHVTPRSSLTAGIAVLGAGAIALAPVQPIPAHIALDPHRVVSDLGVDLLASAIDPITPLIDTIQTTTINFATAAGYWLENPLPILQTIAINQTTYLRELAAGNGNLIPEQIWNNVQTLFQAPFDPGTTVEIAEGTSVAQGDSISKTDAAKFGPLALDKNTIYSFLLQFLATEDLPALISLTPTLNAVNTHISSLLLGVIGPVISPFVQLSQSFTAIGTAFEDGDIVGAINEIINIPTKMTNAFLNGGGYLDLTEIISGIQPLPPQISKIGVELGGLLNVVPQNGSVLPGGTPPTVFSGGVGFDGLAVTADLGDLEGTVPGLPIGLTGSALGLNRYTAQQMRVKPVLPPNPSAAVQSAAEAPAPAEDAPMAAQPDLATPDAPVDSTANLIADTAPAVLDEPAEAAPEIEAEVEAATLADLEIADVEAPAAADDPASAAKTGADDSADSGSRVSDSRRGAGSAD